MQPDSLNSDFRDMLLALADERADFVVVGAWALAYHGHVRATLDFDVLVRPTAENAKRVMAALFRFGAPVQQHGLTEKDLATPGTVYQIGLPPRRIDILTQITGVTFEEAWNTREIQQLESRDVAFLARDQLIKNKRAAGRPKDLADVAELERSNGG
ncbi:MAG: hypothetical protein AB7I09_20420 [Planctomycetota bacterium]